MKANTLQQGSMSEIRSNANDKSSVCQEWLSASDVDEKRRTCRPSKCISEFQINRQLDLAGIAGLVCDTEGHHRSSAGPEHLIQSKDIRVIENIE